MSSAESVGENLSFQFREVAGEFQLVFILFWHLVNLFHFISICFGACLTYNFIDTSKRGSGPRGGGNQEKDGEEMKPLNMMLAGGGGDLGGSKSGGRGIEACKEKLKEGLRASHLRMLPLLSLLTPPTCAAPLIQRSGRRVVLPRRGEVIIWLFIDDVAGGGGVGRCGGGYFILLCLFVARAIIFPIFLFLLCARSWCFSLSSLSKKDLSLTSASEFLDSRLYRPRIASLFLKFMWKTLTIAIALATATSETS